MGDPLRTTADLLDIKKTIVDVEQILCTVPFQTQRARAKIQQINDKHPENLNIYQFIFSSPQERWVSIQEANDAQLYADLEWKRYYLNAKAASKTVVEIQKEWNEEK